MQDHVCKDLFKRKRGGVDFCLNHLWHLPNSFAAAHLVLGTVLLPWSCQRDPSTLPGM